MSLTALPPQRAIKPFPLPTVAKAAAFPLKKKGKTVGIVSPTYAWGLPVIVREFLQKLTLSTKPDYLWFAATYGTTPGQTGKLAEHILCKRGSFGLCEIQRENAGHLDTHI